MNDPKCLAPVSLVIKGNDRGVETDRYIKIAPLHLPDIEVRATSFPEPAIAVTVLGVTGALIALRDLREALTGIGVELPAKRMTAREHLEAAWEAAHVPEDGVIPCGVPYLARDKTGKGYSAVFHCIIPQAVDSNGWERRVLYPPAPAWAKDKHIMATLPNGNTAMLQRIDTGWLSFDGETYTVDQLRDVKRVNVEGADSE